MPENKAGTQRPEPVGTIWRRERPLACACGSRMNLARAENYQGTKCFTGPRSWTGPLEGTKQ